MTWLSTLVGILIVVGLIAWTWQFWRRREKRMQQGCFGCAGCKLEDGSERPICVCPCQCPGKDSRTQSVEDK